MPALPYPAFEIVFANLSSKSAHGDLRGWWPEQRPLPTVGSIVRLALQSVQDVVKARVREVQEFYSPGDMIQSTSGTATLPYVARIVQVIYEEIDDPEGEAKPAAVFHLVPSEVHD